MDGDGDADVAELLLLPPRSTEAVGDGDTLIETVIPCDELEAEAVAEIWGDVFCEGDGDPVTDFCSSSVGEGDALKVDCEDSDGRIEGVAEGTADSDGDIFGRVEPFTVGLNVGKLERESNGDTDLVAVKEDFEGVGDSDVEGRIEGVSDTFAISEDGMLGSIMALRVPEVEMGGADGDILVFSVSGGVRAEEGDRLKGDVPTVEIPERLSER